MHLSLSSIGGTREEQLCILSAVLLWGVVAWLFTARAARKTNAAAATENNLEAPLLEEDEPKHAIRSRVRLASRQAAYYVLAIYYAICFLVYSVRLLRSRGEPRARPVGLVNDWHGKPPTRMSCGGSCGGISRHTSPRSTPCGSSQLAR